MENEQREVLIKILGTVLEQFAFMIGETVEKEEIFIEGERYLHAIINFKGVQSGTLGIAIPAELGVVLASNILGIDEGDEVAVEKSVDALKELLNIFYGQFLTTVYGEEPVFDLSVPDVSEIDKVEWEKLLDSPDAIRMMVEDVPLVANASF